jgi:methionine-gamma-lyase
VHSLTKFINGTSDCVAGCVCGSSEFIHSLLDITCGASMLLGPVLDSHRAASILKNLHSLHIRMQKHSYNGMFLAKNLQDMGVKVFYPGLQSHPHHGRINKLRNADYGYGGMLAFDIGTSEKAGKLMVRMQEEKVGYLAVSLGYFKTLFSAPGHSTSSEIPVEEQKEIGISDGLVRMSVGLDHNIQRTFDKIKMCLEEVGYPKNDMTGVQ